MTDCCCCGKPTDIEPDYTIDNTPDGVHCIECLTFLNGKETR